MQCSPTNTMTKQQIQKVLNSLKKRTWKPQNKEYQRRIHLIYSQKQDLHPNFVYLYYLQYKAM